MKGISDKTNIALGLVIVLFAAVATGAFWVGGVDSTVRQYGNEINKVREIEKKQAGFDIDLEYMKAALKRLEKKFGTLPREQRD